MGLAARCLFVTVISVLLASCVTTEDEPAAQATTESTSSTSAKSDTTELSTSVVDLADAMATEEPRQEATVYRGNDRHVRMPAPEEPVRFVGEDVSLNFEQAPLNEVMHAIMGDILNLDYIVDHPVQGKVTLRTRTPVPRDQLLGVLESLLKANSAIMIRDDQGRYLVTGTARGTKLSPSVSNPGDSAVGYSTIVIPLQYISAANMAEILKPLAEESAFVRIDGSRNLLMLAGTREQLDGWMDIIATFDVDQLKGMSVGLYPLVNSSVDEVSTALGVMLAGGEGSAGGGLSQLIRVIPVTRLNSILVVTPRAHYLDTLEKWITRLDEAHYSEFDRRLYVYPVQNTTASRLADLLNSIYQGGASSGRRGSGSREVQSGSGVAPGMTPETIGSSSQGRSTAVDFSGDGEGGEVLEDVRVVADDENNSLMIYASSMQYRVILAALEQLDIVATQVLIEASILEVTLTDDLRYGLEWTFKNGLGSSYDGSGLLVSGDTSAPASIIPGFSYTVTNSIGDISAVLNALAKESLVNIISTPSVMVLDNHEAFIHVGNQVPIIDKQTTNDASDSSRITQSVTYRDTGVKLKVKPSVNAGGLVTMDVEQSVTDVGDVDSATGQRAFLEREIMSRVAVRSGESVVLGGLIRENATKGSTGVPWLHTLPVVGPMFGTVSDNDTRTELMVIITPRAIYNESELRDVSDEMRSMVRNMELIDASP